MRAGPLDLAVLLFALVLAGCGDLPTSVGTGLPAGDRPSLAGNCVPNGDGVFVCPPLGGGPTTCDPYHFDCGPGDCMTSTGGGDFEAIQSCPGWGGGPGTGPGEPTPPGGGGGGASPPDTCRTGDEVLDSPVVRQGLRDLWQASNPTAPQPQRLEQAAWIVQNADGSFATVPFTDITEQGPCAINGNFYAPPNAVAWVHTHPFQRGEELVVCGPNKRLDPATGRWVDIIGPDGRPDYTEYENHPSPYDRAVMETVNRIRQGEGRNLLSGLIVDNEYTTVFTEDLTIKPVPFPRCGY